jgi:hypothetical protein
MNDERERQYELLVVRHPVVASEPGRPGELIGAAIGEWPPTSVPDGFHPVDIAIDVL